MWGKLRALRDYHTASEDHGASSQHAMYQQGMLSAATDKQIHSARLQCQHLMTQT